MDKKNEKKKMKIYLILFSENYVSKDRLLSYIDGIDSIVNWRSDFVNSVYVKTEMSAENISEKLSAKFGTGRHLVVEISMSEKYGYLPDKTWNFLKMEINKDYFIK